jgi:GPH family glycoside/pentoside/hexuronide:cation symporter
MAQSLSRVRALAYALGSAGYQITDRIVVVVAVYFYLPPAGRGLENQVPSRVILGFLTVYGMAMLFGRIFDSLADPLVGHWSDRSRARLGRRRAFLVAGVVPMVGLPVLLFWPPGGAGSLGNGLWLGAILAAYFVAFTVYVAPYLALIPELATTQSERVRLVTLLVLVGFPIGVGFGAVWTLGYAWGVGSGLTPTHALRAVVVAGSGVALLLCLAPILAVDERRFAATRSADLSLRAALATTLANRAFVAYLAAQAMSAFAINLIQPALPYAATVLLGRDEGFAATLGLATLGGVGVALLLQSRSVAWLGARGTTIVSTLLFGAGAAALGALVPELPGGPRDAANLAIAFVACALVGVAAAGLMVVPHVLLSQLIDVDALRTGANRAAIYFGVQGLLTKWVYGVSLWVFTFLLARFGNSPSDALGVRLVGPVTGVACLLAAILWLAYPERALVAEVETAGRRRE